MTTGWQPRQRRAVETRRRILDAALAEMGRVGVRQARVSDIVEAAGASWGSFYRYFPEKEDVLLDAAAGVAEVFTDACTIGIDAGRQATEVIAGAVLRAVSVAPRNPDLWEATFQALTDREIRLAQVLADLRITPPVEALTAVIDVGQCSGELRGDHPSDRLASVFLTSVWATARRDGPVGLLSENLLGRAGTARRANRGLLVNLLIAGMTERGPGRSPAEAHPHGERIGRSRTRGRDEKNSESS